MNNLQRFDNDGLELLINIENGEVFATQGMIAKLCKQESSSIRYFLSKEGVEESLKDIPVKDSRGVEQKSKLYNEAAIFKALSKYQPSLLVQCAQTGLRVFLHKLAGYEVTSTAVRPKELTPLDILEQQVKWMRQQEAELKKVQLELQQLNEFKNEIRQTQQEAIAHLKHLDPPSAVAAPLQTKEKLNRLIRDYSLANKLSFSYVYSWVYREFRDRYHIDLQVRGKNHKPKLTGMEYAQKYDFIEQLYATASEVLI